MTDIFYAHVDQQDRTRKQTLGDHLLRTAEASRAVGEEINLGNMSYYIGLLHDSGKMKKKFQEKILKNSSIRVDHSSYGGAMTLELFQEISRDLCDDSGNSMWKSLIEMIEQDFSLLIELNNYTNILMYSMMAHHGSYDEVRKNDENEYVYTTLERARREEESPEFKADVEAFEQFLSSQSVDIRQVFFEGFKEYVTVIRHLKSVAEETSDDVDEAMAFYHGMLMRLLVSILKSADIKDTINAYDIIIEDEDDEKLREVVDEFEWRVRDKYASFSAPESALNRSRASIAEAILERSMHDDVGIYTLDLPTGAGKTLLSLRYGVNQMKYQEKRRFFYITSYLSVLEQNADEMRGILKNDAYVLEHHSNIVRDASDHMESRSEDDSGDSLKAARRNFLLDDWTSPVVLTTMVQFFNTLFKGRSANLTRFKSFIDAVVVLDELQSLPNEVLYMTTLALNFMKTVMHTTVILSTATQPAYGSVSLRHRLAYGDRDGEKVDIVTLSSDESKHFERASVAILGDISEEYTIEELSKFVIGQKERSQLIVLNTKSAVRKLYDSVSVGIDEENLYYLTTNLTAHDRLQKIKEIKKRLERDEPICVISTALIEAGVDVDFAVVIRSLSGIDSIVQARGRCNREGRRDEAYTYIINMDHRQENTSPIKGMDDRKLASWLILRHEKDTIQIEDFVAPYFEKLYANLNNRDLTETLELLSKNEKKRDIFEKLASGVEDVGGWLVAEEEELILNFFQSFREAYDNFNLIDNVQHSVIVDYGPTKDGVNEIRNLEQKYRETFDPSVLKEIKLQIRNLSRYTVPMSDRRLGDCENILDGTVYILGSEYYDSRFGVTEEFGLSLL
ncbi:MAG: CRISPR-associated helicase Cas3' [Firmicutes bacterium]|nr:CRISPR-associated helicase Cas3' [Bacillota bacterium]